MDVTTIDEAKALLYGNPADAFVAERDVLVKAIRASGDRELANLIKALRRPSAVAALVNDVARQDPQGVELLLQAAALLRSAQAGALEGSGVNAAELQQQYRAAVGALAQSAPDRRAEVRAALEAATIDEASNQDLRAGCLVVVPTPVSILGVGASTDVAAAAPAAIDELEARRARRRDEQAAKETAAAEKTAAKKVAADQAAAAKKAAATAERERKAAEKERQKKLKALQKQHREALRSHLVALDQEAAAATASERVDQDMVQIDDDIAAAERALEALRQRREQLANERVELTQAREGANRRVGEALAQAEALAAQLAELEPR